MNTFFIQVNTVCFFKKWKLVEKKLIKFIFWYNWSTYEPMLFKFKMIRGVLLCLIFLLRINFLRNKSQQLKNKIEYYKINGMLKFFSNFFVEVFKKINKKLLLLIILFKICFIKKYLTCIKWLNSLFNLSFETTLIFL